MKRQERNGYYLTKLNKETAKAQAFIYVYNKAREEKSIYLYNVYNSYSKDKARAYQQCKNIQKALCGECGYIMGHSIQGFTYGFISNNDLYIITKSNNYIIENAF